MSIRLGTKVSFSFVEDADEMPLWVLTEYTPGRPCPPCSNPDSPAFSDSGDPSEFNIIAVLDNNGGHMAEMLWRDNDKFIDAVGEALDKAYEDMGPA